MENFPKAPGYASEDERVENSMNGMHVDDVVGVNAQEGAPIPEAPAGVSENGVATGVDKNLEAEADDWLAGRRRKPVAPSVESEAPLGEEADGAGEATTV